MELTVVVVQVPAAEVPGLDLGGRLLSPEQPRLRLAFHRRVLAVGVDVHPADLALQALPSMTWRKGKAKMIKNLPNYNSNCI